MLQLTTNHKVGDDVYVLTDCVRRGIVQQINFAQNNDVDDRFDLSYDILYDGFAFNTNIVSAVDYRVSGTELGSPLVGSPLKIGSPVGDTGSPLGSPRSGGVGSPDGFNLLVDEEINGGGIYKDKDEAVTAFGDTLV